MSEEHKGSSENIVEAKDLVEVVKSESGEESDHDFESAEDNESEGDVDDHQKADRRRRRSGTNKDESEESGDDEPQVEVEPEPTKENAENDSIEDLNEPREDGDGQEAEDESLSKVDKDEDRRNPQFIPKKGIFYEHDDRIDSDEENEASKKAEQEEESKKKKRVWKSEAIDKWGHDKFLELEQTPKSKEELVEAYGYDIRAEDNAPRARRRRRYGRGPNKYTKDWKDKNASSGRDNIGRGGAKGGGWPSRRGAGNNKNHNQPRLNSEEDFPKLKNDHSVSKHEEKEDSGGSKQQTSQQEWPQREAPLKPRSSNRAEHAPSPKEEQRRFASGRGGNRRKEESINKGAAGTEKRGVIQSKSGGRSITARDKLSNERLGMEKDDKTRERRREDNNGQREDRRTPKTNKPAERKVDIISDDLIKVTIEDKRTQKASRDLENDNDVNSKQSKRYSSLRQPKNNTPLSEETGKKPNAAYPDLSDFSNKAALAAAFPAGHFPNGPPNAAPFLNTQQPQQNQQTAAPISTQQGSTAAAPAPYINPNGMVNYGPPPVQYTPVTVPISLPLVGVPHDTFVPPGAVTAVPGGPLLPAHLVSSPEQQVLLAATNGTQGYAVERGGVTYFNPTAQAPIMQRPVVNKRPKAAIPIVDPSQLGGSKEGFEPVDIILNRKESSEISPQSSLEESESSGNKVSETVES